MNTHRPRALRGPGLVLLVAFLGAPGWAACGDEAVAYSETVSLKLSGIKEGDVATGTASEEKNVNTESGNPYGEFLKTARDRLGGRDPGSVTPTAITVRVNADSKNVARVEQVFATIEVFFANSQTTIPVARLTAPAGTSIPMPLLAAVDYEPIADSMLSGDFKVGVRGTTVDAVPSDFDLKLTLDVVFRADP